MPQEKIIIKFEPKGHPELIAAIKKLNVETKKLTGGGGLGGTTIAAKKFSSAAANLTAKLKVQNITWKQLGVSSEILKKAYQGNRIALEKLRIAMAGSNAQSLLGVRNNRLLANSFATLRSQLLLISFGAMLVERALVSLVKSYGRQEAANEKLAVGLTNVAGTTEGVTQRLIDYSSALQKVTAFGDEMITTGMVQFTTFGLNEEAIKALTPQVLNVARAIQTVSGAMPDLNSLFIAFGKATTTGIGTLTRYGVVLTEVERAQLGSMDANESAVKIAEILDRQYGGLADAYAKTTSGMLEAAAAARGDAAEAFGEVLAPIVLGMSEALKAMFEAMSPERIKRFFTAVGTGALAFGLLSGNIWKAVKAIRAFNIAQIRTGWGALAAGVGLVAFAMMEYFDVFEDVNDVQEDYEKRLKALTGEKHIFTAQVYAAIDAINAEKEAFSMFISLDKKFLDAKEKEASLYQRLQQMKDGMSETDIQLLEIKRGEIHALELFNLRLIDETEFKTRLYALDIKRLKLTNKITEETKLTIMGINAISSALASAAINGEHMGDAVVNSLKAIATQLVSKMAVYTLMAALFPGAGLAIGKGSALKFALGIAHDGGLIKDDGKVQRFATGGRVSGGDNVPILAQGGEFVMSRSAVQSVGIENLNAMNAGGGGSTVNVTVAGNVLTQDFVEGELAENIKEAIRRGTDFGIS